MITLNLTPHDDVGGTFNINENRKKTIFEAIDNLYLDTTTSVNIIIHETFDEIIERGLSSSEVNILMDDNDLFDIISQVLYKWDIDVIKME